MNADQSSCFLALFNFPRERIEHCAASFPGIHRRSSAADRFFNHGYD
jgi:hypothetical protein